MSDRPIQGLMVTAMENLKEMVDVNKIVGDPVETPDGHVIIPVSKISYGFVAGGAEYETTNVQERGPNRPEQFPFGGGSGGGISINPMAFLVVGPGEIRLLPVDKSAIYDRMLDLAPQAFQYIKSIFEKEQPAK